MNSIQFHNRTHTTTNTIGITDPTSNNSFFLPEYGGHVKVYEKKLTGPITITVGPGGQFSTLNEAFREALKYDAFNYIRKLESPLDQMFPITILLKTGFVMREMLVLSGGFNFSYIKIKTETHTILSREALQNDTTITGNNIPGLAYYYKSFFLGLYGVNFPILEGDFRIDTSGQVYPSNRYYENMIMLVTMLNGANCTVATGSRLEGGFFTLYINNGGTVIANACTLKGNRTTVQLVRLHSGEVDLGRAVLELGTDLDPNLQTYGSKCCLSATEGGIVKLILTTFKNSPLAIESTRFLSIPGCRFENITGGYAIIGKGINVEQGSVTTSMGRATFTYNAVNTIQAGKGLMIR